ncbi:hypothetical protein BD413DRAFT_207910 [Trametes elegans]|nr:hypothetical protein BD413DRAFT_207910 [Trametes elegans]
MCSPCSPNSMRVTGHRRTCAACRAGVAPGAGSLELITRSFGRRAGYAANGFKQDFPGSQVIMGMHMHRRRLQQFA